MPAGTTTTSINILSNSQLIIQLNFFLHVAFRPEGFATTLTVHTTLGRTPLDEWYAPRRDLFLTTHNTHKRKTSMLPAEFEPTIPARKRPQTDALGRAATSIGIFTLGEVKSETPTAL